MTARKAWSDAENAAVVSLYFAMLDAAIAGKPYNKAAMIRNVQFAPLQTADDTPRGVLGNRSRGSIESKLMNCSAAHAAIDPDAITMDGFGYRKLANYQGLLKTAMRNELTRRRAAEQYADDAAEYNATQIARNIAAS